MADINLNNYNSVATHSYTGTDTGQGINSIDDNFSTFQGGEATDIVFQSESWYTCISQHVYDKAYTINSIKYRLYSYVTQSYSGYTNYTTKIEYTTDGTNWSTVPDTEVTGGSSGGEGGSSHTYDSGTLTKTVNLANCKGIRAYVYGFGHTAEGHTTARSYIYEIQAFGQPYDDIGLRFYDGGVKKIGVLTNSTACKGKIRKGSTTYGIPIVDTTDARAGIRITLSGGVVKALPTTD